jgi:hypothetical protein
MKNNVFYNIKRDKPISEITFLAKQVDLAVNVKRLVGNVTGFINNSRVASTTRGCVTNIGVPSWRWT